ncbi:hypothetical protein ECE50_015655 [Chitinophaga sp. Mgbs1]|uniref:Uncharacterized protein n=1 Tax=Chitinophaga solisilvae TaxID=1233460 RepID=A0A9Q5DCL2_9BACT|nr:hypothetical protein [Chitinophaga solisilvae]
MPAQSSAGFRSGMAGFSLCYAGFSNRITWFNGTVHTFVQRCHQEDAS